MEQRQQERQALASRLLEMQQAQLKRPPRSTPEKYPRELIHVHEEEQDNGLLGGGNPLEGLLGGLYGGPTLAEIIPQPKPKARGRGRGRDGGAAAKAPAKQTTVPGLFAESVGVIEGRKRTREDPKASPKGLAGANPTPLTEIVRK